MEHKTTSLPASLRSRLSPEEIIALEQKQSAAEVQSDDDGQDVIDDQPCYESLDEDDFECELVAEGTVPTDFGLPSEGKHDE